MRVSDWIADYLYKTGVKRVHGLMGGGAAGLNDGFIKHPGIEYICYHHEQGAGHAALGEAKYTGKLAVVNPTTGCAGTNCATSVLNGYQDGVPVLFLSGNVKLDNTTRWLKTEHNLNIRHYGAQEHNIVDTVKSMTKFSDFVTSAEMVPYTIQKAVAIATSGRPGPVWIDIPSNVQLAKINDIRQHHFSFNDAPLFRDAITLTSRLAMSDRPIVVVGQGVRQAGCVHQFMRFVIKHNLPFVTTYGTQDYAAYDHPLNIGTPGVRGNRSGNFAMQNADLLLFLGTSLGAPVIGYDPSQFNPSAYKIYVDVELDELNKDIIPIDWKIEADIKQFLGTLI
jgi:acetolactate synthase-1/2/3 large subunit